MEFGWGEFQKHCLWKGSVALNWNYPNTQSKIQQQISNQLAHTKSQWRVKAWNESSSRGWFQWGQSCLSPIYFFLTGFRRPACLMGNVSSFRELGLSAEITGLLRASSRCLPILDFCKRGHQKVKKKEWFNGIVLYSREKGFPRSKLGVTVLVDSGNWGCIKSAMLNESENFPHGTSQSLILQSTSHRMKPSLTTYCSAGDYATIMPQWGRFVFLSTRVLQRVVGRHRIRAIQGRVVLKETWMSTRMGHTQTWLL